MGARAERRKERSGKGRRRRIRAIRTLSWNATDIGSFVASSTREDDNSPLNTAITTVVFRWRRNSCVNRVEIRTGNGSVRGIIVNSCLIRCQRWCRWHDFMRWEADDKYGRKRWWISQRCSYYLFKKRDNALSRSAMKIATSTSCRLTR